MMKIADWIKRVEFSSEPSRISGVTRFARVAGVSRAAVNAWTATGKPYHAVPRAQTLREMADHVQAYASDIQGVADEMRQAADKLE